MAETRRALPSVTACLVTHNRPHYVRDCLESLRRQSVGTGAFDIIVVDSCGTPSTNARLREHVEGMPNARLLRVERPGASAARNLGAEASTADFIAYIDDDGLAAGDWIEQIQRVAAEHDPWPGVIGGRVLPVWEKPLPAWWPESLRGVLSIIEWEGRGEFRTPQVPRGLEPYGVNMVVQRKPLLEMGGFADRLGRFAGLLLSDEDVQVGWKLQDLGLLAWYDSRLLVHHQIQAGRMAPEWLLNRLYWQGASTVATRRMLGDAASVWRELPRRLVVELLTAPASLLPNSSTRLLGLRWRLAYARGFTRMALAGEQRKRYLPGRVLQALLRRDAEPIIPHLDIGARAGVDAPRKRR
ncbi:glycosyltransferase family 2 protein [Siccirubricoccus deserti]|uniref:Glycosyltransferase family 2 protein n=1 Tax=Siccirubricoccus deserti TaxID=2013562 RepID=A0A9X0QWG1_9PROT|nr:glycosyltransferase family 2 protein [Siccirubricoccus deserti]MBC4014692.1 glycosyltransferase family 2 protein [Siccirubricoccus deserti]